MLPTKRVNAPFNPAFFPQQILLLSAGENIMPMGYWTVISKDPFRFLICMGVGNYSLGLLKKYKEVALHFMPWEMREKVIAAGYLSGRDVKKAEKLGFQLTPAEKLKHTSLVAGSEVTFETVVNMELMNLSREFAPFVLDVLAVHGQVRAMQRSPIFYLGQEDFMTIGEHWRYVKP